MRPVVTIVAVLMFATTVLTAGSEAEACSPAPSFPIEIVEEDTPDCIELTPYPHEATLEVENNCEETFYMEADECPACQEEFELQPSGPEGKHSSDRLKLEQRSTTELNDGDTFQQYYEWSLEGDEQKEGVVTTESEYRDTSGACDHTCSTTGDSAPLGAVIVVVLGVVGLVFRRRTAST